MLTLSQSYDWQSMSNIDQEYSRIRPLRITTVTFYIDPEILRMLGSLKIISALV